MLNRQRAGIRDQGSENREQGAKSKEYKRRGIILKLCILCRLRRKKSQVVLNSHRIQHKVNKYTLYNKVNKHTAICIFRHISCK